MFRAINQTEDGPIVSLDSKWGDPMNLESLRLQCRAGHVCCPFCRSTVSIRAGEFRRRYFAHDIRSNCPLAEEDAIRLAGRQLIYTWLCSRLPPGSVSLEEELPGVSLPSPVDVVCHLQGLSFGYYFVHRNVRKLEDRAMLEHALQQPGNPQVRVFISDGLVEFEQSGRNWVYLPPSARQFRKMSSVGWPHGFGDSLHLLNVTTEFLTTLRDFRLVENPKCFRFGHRKDNKLSDVDLKRDSGEIFHPGEDEEVQRRNEEMRRGLGGFKHLESVRSSLPSGLQISPRQGLWNAKSDDTLAWTRRPDVNCEVCGRLTPEEDQIVYHGTTNTCHCRDCMTQ